MLEAINEGMNAPWQYMKAAMLPEQQMKQTKRQSNDKVQHNDYHMTEPTHAPRHSFFLFTTLWFSYPVSYSCSSFKHILTWIDLRLKWLLVPMVYMQKCISGIQSFLFIHIFAFVFIPNSLSELVWYLGKQIVIGALLFCVFNEYYSYFPLYSYLCIRIWSQIRCGQSNC